MRVIPATKLRNPFGSIENDRGQAHFCYDLEYRRQYIVMKICDFCCDVANGKIQSSRLGML